VPFFVAENQNPPVPPQPFVPPAQPGDIQVNLGAADFEINTAPVAEPVEAGPGEYEIDVPADFGVETVNVPQKEVAAKWVAQAIVLTFGVSTALLILLGFAMFFWLRWAPDKITVIVTGAMVPYIEKIATFASTVFGPLLAFILGYYFGQKHAAS
jgi:hypothetical protein